MKALVGAFNQEKALVGAFSVIVQPVVEAMDRFTALDRIYKYFNTEARDDIDLEEWIKGFNVILKGENLKSINIDGCTDIEISRII